MRSTVTRLTRALNCLSSLRRDPRDYGVANFNISRCFDVVEGQVAATTQKFCLVHVGLDPLPMSATFGGCIPDQCTNVEMTDLLNVVCAMPTCELLAPVEMMMEDVPLVDICGYVQRGICGPEDRTMMQHEISFTCVSPPMTKNRRRLLATVLSTSTELTQSTFNPSASTLPMDDFTKWLIELDRQLVETVENLIQSLRLEELMDFTSHLLEDLTHVVKDEFDDLWLGLQRDIQEDADDLKNIFRNNTEHRIDVLMQNVKRRLVMRLDALKESFRVLETKIQDDGNTAKLRDLISTVQIDIKYIAHNDLAKIEEHVSQLTDEIRQWLHKRRSPEVAHKQSSHKSINLRRVSRILAQLDIEDDFDSPIVLKLRDILERTRMLIQSDLPILQEDISKFFKDFEQFVQKLYGIVFDELTTTEDTSDLTDPAEIETTEQITSTATTTPTSTAAEVSNTTTSDNASGLVSTVEFRKLFELRLSNQITTIARETIAETSSTEGDVIDLERQLSELKELLLDFIDQIRINDSAAAKQTFTQIVALVTTIGKDLFAWKDAQLSQARMMLEKFRQKCIIDRKARLVYGKSSRFDTNVEILSLIEGLVAMNPNKIPLSSNAAATSTEPMVQRDWPSTVSKFLKELTIFSEDVLKISTKTVAAAATDETLRRDLEKLNKRFADISYLFTTDIVEVWAHWRNIVDSDLQKIDTSIDEIITNVKAEVDKLLKEDEDFRQSIISTIKDVGQNWAKVWEEFWNETISKTSDDADDITQQIRTLTKTLDIAIRDRVQKIIDGFHDVESSLRKELEVRMMQLRADVQSMVEELKQTIEELERSMTSSTSTVSVSTTRDAGPSTAAISASTSQQTTREPTKQSSTAGQSSTTAAPANARALEETFDDLDISTLSKEILSVVRAFSSETKGLQDLANNSTFVAEIMMHFRPTKMFRDIEVSQPLWTTQSQLESVFTCGLESITEPTRLVNSGHMPQSLGDYEGCLGEDQANSPNRYCLVKGSAIVGEGRCVSKTCNEDSMHDLTEFICSWIRHDRSCLELINIIPADYCIFASLANCGALAKIPDTADPLSFIHLPAWYSANRTAVEDMSWWSPESIASLGLLSGDAHTLNANVATAHNNIDYNMTEIAENLGLPKYQVYCSRTEESYWNGRSIAGLCLIIVVLGALPILAYVYPRVLGNWRFHVNFTDWIKRGLVRDDTGAIVRAVPTSALDGIRVISMFWIIWGHTLATVLMSNLLENYVDTLDLISSFSMQGVISGVFAVDTFFAVSAFLLAFKSEKIFGLGHNASTQKLDDFMLYSKTVFGAVYKRWARLSPLYYFIFAVYILSVPYLVSAPMYGAYSYSILEGFGDKQGCRTQWFWHLIYVDNLVPLDSIDSCMGWSWYLANEMQLSILGIALVVSACRSREGYRRLWWLAFVLAGAWTMTLELQNHFTLGFLSLSTVQAKKDMTLDFQTALARQRSYIRPWPRMLGYLIALSAGLHIADEQRYLERAARENHPNEQPLLQSPYSAAESTPMMLRSELARGTQEANHQSVTYEPILYKKIKNWVIPGHVIALLTMAIIIWTPWYKGHYYPDDWPYGLTLLYNVFSRSIWTLALLWFVYTCFLAHHKIIKDPLTTLVNNMLSWRGFTLFSPIVFGVYLIHMIIQGMYYASIPVTATVSISEGFHEFLGWAPISFALAIPLYLLVEVPASRLL